MLFFHQNNQFEAACFAEFSILTKIAVSGPYRRGNFVGWFFWLSFSNVENTLRILLKHSKFCSFIKTISLKQKQHVLRTFQFWPKSLYPDLTSVAIFLVDFFVWVFQMLKIPFEFFWNIQNFVLSSKQSVWSKNSMFCGLFNFDQNRCIRTLPAWPFFGWFFWLSIWMLKIPFQFFWNIQNVCSFIKTISLKQKQHVLRTFQFWPKSLYPDLTSVAIFFVDFLKCWKYPSNSSETFKILFFHQNNQFVAKTASFAYFSILTKIAVSGTYRRDHFVCLIFLVEMLKIPFEFFWNIQNFVLSSKQSACFAEFSILTKIAVSGPYRRGHFLVDWFFEMLKIPFQFFWNIQNVVLSSKQSAWSKNSMFCGLFNFDQNRCIRTLPAWPFCWLIFLLEFFKCWKYPSNSSETFKMLFFHQNNQFEAKTACFADFSILTKIAVSGPYRGHFVGWFFWLSFLKCWKYPSNSSETFKMLFFHQNNQFEAKTACFADFSILTKIAVSGPYRRGHFVSWFFWLIFWNVENTLPILLEHSKCCSFIKTISLKEKQHVSRTFQFWPKSLYPDHYQLVAIFWLSFSMLKIPFEFFWNIQNFVLSSKQSVWSKNSMFCGLFNFDENRCIRALPAWPFLLVDFFGWVFQMLKMPFQFFWNIRTLPAYPAFPTFCWLIFLLDFLKCWKYPSNSSETFKILFFHQNNQFEAKTACFGDFSILTKIAVSGPYRHGHFVSWFFCWFFWFDFLKCWKYPSNSSETFKMLFFHQNNQHVLRNFQFWPKSLYPDLTGVAILLVDFFGWVFWNVENTLPILLKHSKCCSFIKTTSLKQKQHVFAEFWILTKIAASGPYRRGHFVSWFFCLIFSNVENTLRILLKHSKFCSFIKTISMFCWVFNFDQNRCTGPEFSWLIFFVEFFEMLKIPFEFFWNIQNVCSFINTTSLKEKQHVLRTFQFWPKSLYPDFPILLAWPFC